jgi:peptide/nickel transport system substrate-binding protein
LGLTALLLAACGSSGDGKAKKSGSVAPKRGGTLHTVQGADIVPATLLGQNNPNFSVNRTVFNTLTEYDRKTLQPRPSLARSWTVSPDGRTYKLQLRDDVKYHSGRPFGPDDVIFTIGQVAAKDSTSQGKFAASAISDASKTGPSEVTLQLSDPINSVFDLFEIMIMVDQESFADLMKGTRFIGTGPFTVQSYKPGNGLSLKANQSYWVPGRPYLDGIEISIDSEPAAALAALRSGQAQLALDLPPASARSIMHDSAFDVIAADANDAAYYLGANVKVAPLDSKEVRQAISWAIDRDRILKQGLGGIGQATSLPWSPASPAFDAAQAKHYSFDPDKAKQLLKQAGQSSARIGLYYNNANGVVASIAQIVQNNLSSVGLDCTLKPLQPADFTARLNAGTVPGLEIAPHGFGQLHPATLVNGAKPFKATGNVSNFESPEYTALAAQVATASDADAKALYQKVNSLLLDEQFVIDLVSSSHTFSTSTRLHGVNYTMYDYLNLDDAFLA